MILKFDSGSTINAFSALVIALIITWIQLSAPALCADADDSAPRIRSKVPTGVQLYFATSRLNDGSRSAPSYGGSRHLDLGSGSLEYGTAALRTPPHMTSPSQTKTGAQYRDSMKADAQLWRQAKINFVGCFDEDDLLDKVRKCTGKICIYIHGYDKPFEEALQDASMLFADYSQYTDSKHQFVPILFSWPSSGGRSKYSVDEANLEWSRHAFTHFMDRIVKEKNPDATLDVVAHSMGNRLLVPYVIEEHGDLKKPYVNNLFLCSADVDFHSFEAYREQVEQSVNGLVYIFVSDKDRPLIMSQIMHGEPRLGRPVDAPGPDPAKTATAAKIGGTDFWLNIATEAAEIWLGPSCTDTPDVLAWLAANPSLDKEFGERTRLIDVSDLALETMGHGIAWPVVSAIMAGYLEFPLLRGHPVHKRPDKTYLLQCGGKPRVLYRYIRLDPIL